MKTPNNIGGNNLVTWLQTATEIRMADLYTVTLKNGSVLRYTTWDATLNVAGNTFLTGPPHIRRSHIEEKLGLDISALELGIAAGAADTVNGVPVLQLIANGAFDGALLTIDRLFMDAAGSQIGTVVRFSGTIGEVEEVGRSSAKLTVNALVEQLKQPLPAIILQPNCTNTLFDARCTLRKSNRLLYSDQFDNALWVKGSTGATAAPAVTPDVAAGPDGLTTADQIVFPASDATSNLTVAQGITIPAPSAGSFYCFSIWLRSDAPVTTNLLMYMRKDGPLGTPLLSVSGNGGALAVTTAWQQFFFSGDAGANASTSLFAVLRLTTSQPGITIQASRAKLEVGRVPTAYEATTGLGAAFDEANIVEPGSTVNKLISLSAKADGYYDNGQITFTSGPNNGLVKAVRQYLGRTFFFNSPLPFAPNAGDTFTAYPGCDKTQQTCTTKFNNLANFEGFPYVPVPETAI